MGKARLAALLFVLVGSTVPLSAAGASPPERYIVVLEDSAGDPGAVASEHERSYGAQVSLVYRFALRGYAAEMSPQAAGRIGQDPRVDYVERDLPRAAFAQTLPTGVNRIEADLSSTAAGDGAGSVDVDIAILDSGIDLDHPDLNVVASTKCSGGSPTKKSCTDGGGDDDNGHGSHVAGIAAALDNTVGVVGVAPGARLHAVKVLDSRGSGYTSWIIAGIDWVTARAATIEVANMSLGGGGYSSSEHTAVKNSVAKGVVYTVAAGNSAKDVYGADLKFGTSDDTQPAAYPEVSTISALADTDGQPGGLKNVTVSFTNCTESKDDSFACFSNYSQVATNNPVVSTGAKIDLMLPGYRIYSTYKSGSYATVDGTSQAAPHAAGLAGLYISKNGRATSSSGVYSIRQALIDMGQAQTSTNGLTTHDDPDLNKEGIGWAATL